MCPCNTMPRKGSGPDAEKRTAAHGVHVAYPKQYLSRDLLSTSIVVKDGRIKRVSFRLALHIYALHGPVGTRRSHRRRRSISRQRRGRPISSGRGIALCQVDRRRSSRRRACRSRVVMSTCMPVLKRDRSSRRRAWDVHSIAEMAGEGHRVRQRSRYAADGFLQPTACIGAPEHRTTVGAIGRAAARSQHGRTSAMMSATTTHSVQRQGAWQIAPSSNRASARHGAPNGLLIAAVVVESLDAQHSAHHAAGRDATQHSARRSAQDTIGSGGGGGGDERATAHTNERLSGQP
jgi:hypothetical protein